MATEQQRSSTDLQLQQNCAMLHALQLRSGSGACSFIHQQWPSFKKLIDIVCLCVLQPMSACWVAVVLTAVRCHC